MILCHVKIKIGVNFSLPSGDYATYLNWKGFTAWTRNLGYSPNDLVDIFHDRNAKPRKLIINGIEKQIPE